LIIAYEQLIQTMKLNNPNRRLFISRLVCLNKLKDNSIPTKLDIRPIAITGLIQKLVEKVLLNHSKTESKINCARPDLASEKERRLLCTYTDYTKFSIAHI
jgi:hypothetical protein